MAERQRSRSLKINFEGVDQEIRRRSARVHIPEGDYKVKIVDAEVLKSERTDSRYIKWKTQVTEGKYKGKTLFGTTSLKKDALWSLRNLIHAATTKNVAGRSVNFNPENLYGKTVGAAVEDNVFEDSNGKERITSQISTFFPASEVGEAAEDEDEEEEDEEEEYEDEDDEEELEDVDVDDI